MFFEKPTHQKFVSYQFSVGIRRAFRTYIYKPSRCSFNLLPRFSKIKRAMENCHSIGIWLCLFKFCWSCRPILQIPSSCNCLKLRNNYGKQCYITFIFVYCINELKKDYMNDGFIVLSKLFILKKSSLRKTFVPGLKKDFIANWRAHLIHSFYLENLVLPHRSSKQLFINLTTASWSDDKNHCNDYCFRNTARAIKHLQKTQWKIVESFVPYFPCPSKNKHCFSFALQIPFVSYFDSFMHDYTQIVSVESLI